MRKNPFCLLTCLPSLFVLLYSPVASAQSAYAGLDHINRIVHGTPGITTAGITTGAVATAAGDVLVKPSGLKIPVSVAANVVKGRILTAAMGCTTPLGLLVCAATAVQIGVALKNAAQGYADCPSATPGYICKPQSLPDTYPGGSYRSDCTAGRVTGSSQDSVMEQCRAAYETYWRSRGYPTCSVGISNVTRAYPLSYTLGYCGTNYQNLTVQLDGAATCPSGATLVNGVCTGATGPLVPATDAQVQLTLQQRMDADFQENRRLYDALKADQAATEAANKTWPDAYNPVKADTPVTVTAPPVTSVKRVTKTETLTNTDGTTSTRTTEEQTTYTPTTSGTTVGDAKTTFPSQTTITTTTTNNTTNVSNVETTVINSDPIQEKQDIPTDYAREGTLREVRDAVTAVGAPTLPDQGKVVTDAKTKSDTDLQTARTGVETGMQTDKAGFFSWVWTPPLGACVPISGAVSVGAINWDVCPTVANIREVLGWLLALLSAFEIYGQLFRRNDA